MPLGLRKSVPMNSAFLPSGLSLTTPPVNGRSCEWNDFLTAGHWIKEHDGVDGSPLPNQEELRSHSLSLARMNLAHYFAPSFFIEAT